jgi:hypothetical protein
MKKPKAKPSRHFEPTSKSPSQTESPFEPTADSRPHRVFYHWTKTTKPGSAVTNQHKRAEAASTFSQGRKTTKSAPPAPEAHKAGPVNTIFLLSEEDRDIATADFSPTLRLPGKPHARAKHCPLANRNQKAHIRARWYFGVGLVLPPCEGESFSLSNTATA